MRVLQIEIYGFRGVKEGVVQFGPHDVLVGESGSGKSTILEALWLVFSKARHGFELTEHDFWGSNPAPGDRFRIIVTLAGFKGNDPAQNVDWFGPGRGVPSWWDPSSKSVQAEKAGQDDPLCCQVGYAGRFDHFDLTVETVRYFHDGDDQTDPFLEEGLQAFPSRLLDDVGFFILPALRTREQLASFGSYLFRRAVAASGALPAESVLLERDRLRRPDRPFEEHASLQGLVARVNERLAELISSGPSLKLRITSTDSNSVLSSIIPHYETPDSPALPVARHGTGLLSLQALLLLLEIGEARRRENKSFILALEEPELHLHPGVQRRILHMAQGRATQTICTTHSPRVAGFYSTAGVRLVQTHSGQMSVRALRATPLGRVATSAMRKLFLDNRAPVVEAMMHPSVLVPEGRTDFEWLRILCEALEVAEEEETTGAPTMTPFGAVVGVVPTHNAAVAETYQELRKVHDGVVVLVDGDAAGKGYLKGMAKLNPPPAVAIRWRDFWTIEDVVGWLLEGDSVGALPLLKERLSGDFSDVASVVNLLKRETEKGGRKGDLVGYEDVVSVIHDVRGCRKRALALLEDLASACAGPTARHFGTSLDALSHPGVAVVVLPR